MQRFLLIGLALGLAGCALPRRKGVSHVDPYDSVKVDQMVGNYVHETILAKTVLGLNARRETRLLTALTNVNVVNVTNPVVVATTNQIVSLSTNYTVTRMTNATPSPVAEEDTAATEAASGNGTAPKSDATPVVVAASPTVSSNTTVTLSTNQTATVAPNQTSANTQVIRNYNNQLTTISNNVSISTMTNQVITAETNLAVNYVTNYVISAITNVTIAPTNLPVHDYFLYTELIPPPDFTLANGETLILLVDGVRYGFSATNSSLFLGRKGFTSTLYPASPEVLVAIANAREVKVRVRGTTTAIEKDMNGRSIKSFKKYLLKYFRPVTAEPKSKLTTEPLKSPRATQASSPLPSARRDLSRRTNVALLSNQPLNRTFL